MPYAPHGIWYEETGSGEAVVLLHEGVVDSRIWRPVVPLLADRFRVVAYDQRGYGQSPMWDEPYSLVEDLMGVLDGVGIERAALVGASRGGGIALAAAVEAPDRVSALVLVGSALPGHRLEIEGTPEQEARWEAADERGDLQELAQIDLEVWAPLGADDELRAMFHENAAASNGDDPAAAHPDVKARLGEIGVPTLVITGAHDVPAINEVGEILAAGIPGAKHAGMEDADHMHPWRSPDELATLIRRFLTPE
jgi:pimeloyl-ACP methyl ester carboxylesterase